MAKLLRLRRGTTTDHSTFTGAEGEVTVDITKDTAVVHDGTTAGGRPLLREDLNNLAAGAIGTTALADDSVTAAKLADTTVTAGSYGSATAIPALTIDAQGRITAASTNVVNTTTDLTTTTAASSVTINSSTGTDATISAASSTDAGVMTSADKSKLDGIASGAQVNSVTSVAGKTGAVTLASSDVGLGSVENKSSATIRGEITSGNVTSALGYTPYNSSNPNGYITSSGSVAKLTTASGNAPSYSIRAWCYWNGSNGSISNHGNTSSMSRTANGRYTWYFSSSMPSSQYALIGGGSENGGNDDGNAAYITFRRNTPSASTTQVNLMSRNGGDWPDLAISTIMLVC